MLRALLCLLSGLSAAIPDRIARRLFPSTSFFRDERTPYVPRHQLLL